MLNENFLSLFVFFFSIISTLRLLIKFISALLQNPPQKIELSSRELIFYGIFLSYLITYSVTKI